MVDGFNFLIPVWQNVGLYKFIFYDKSYVPCEDLIIIFNDLRPVYRDFIFFQNSGYCLHFLNHVFLQGVCTCLYMLCRLRIVSIFEFWSWPITYCGAKNYSFKGSSLDRNV